MSTALPAGQPFAIPLFADFTAEQVQIFLDAMRPIELRTGQVLIREGDPGDRLYIIAQGEMEVIKALGQPNEYRLAMRTAGDFIGEASLFQPDQARGASVRAVSNPTRVFEMTHAEFVALLHRHPSVAYEAARIISQRLDQMAKATIRDLESKNQQLSQAYAELQAAHEQIVQKEKLEKELAMAREIQLSILPISLPTLPGYDFAGRMQAARQVGGDFYDIFRLSDTQIGVMVGDVSDKGVPAAIFMALTRSLVRAEAMRLQPPGATLQTVNNHLLEMSTGSLFVTVLYGILDGPTRTFHYVRAGHELPLMRMEDGSLYEPPTLPGMLMGVFPNIPLDDQTLELPPGSSLALCSDGVTDATNPLGETFGRQRLRQCLHDMPLQDAQATCMMVFNAAISHQGSADQFDDMTLVVLHVKPLDSNL